MVCGRATLKTGRADACQRRDTRRYQRVACSLGTLLSWIGQRLPSPDPARVARVNVEFEGFYFLSLSMPHLWAMAVFAARLELDSTSSRAMSRGYAGAAGCSWSDHF